MRQLILAWYTWLSALSQGFVFSLGEWTEWLNLAPASAVLFGLIAAASPCQLTTNLGALAYAARESSRSATFSAALAYAAGKVSVYMVVGVLVV
ncbi:MAG: sulfite exporter TauE/SafE family protein, partial [Candidatus Rokubacteria bacterium]|nr:sulfite exporter TauE/SafE family protein [Candidatus Rokubacteria bacterium]